MFNFEADWMDMKADQHEEEQEVMRQMAEEAEARPWPEADQHMADMAEADEFEQSKGQ